MTDRRKSRSRSIKDGDQFKTGNASGFGGATVGAHAAGNQAAASDIFLEGMKNFLEEAGKKTPKPQLKGNLFEYIEAAKLNRNVALAGKGDYARVTARIPGRGTDAADILIGSNQVQLKAYENLEQLAAQACDPKYDGMKILVPFGMADKVNLILEERGVSTRVIEELKSSGISSGGTTPKDLDQATKHPKRHFVGETAGRFAEEAIETGTWAAAAGALIGGTLSAVKNGFDYRDGQIDGQQALVNIVQDAGRSGARSGAVGVLGVGVRHGARHLGLPMKSNIATAVAAAVVEVGVTVYDFARGEISAEEAGERIGETGCSAAGGMYAGAVAGSVFGPPGAVVGSMVGYMATAWVYQGCMAVLKQARLAEEEAARLEALCSEAVQGWNRQQQEFESRMTGFLEERHTAFGRCFEMIDEALEADDTDKAVRSLARLAAMTGSALKFEGFEEFKEFMEQETDVRLVI